MNRNEARSFLLGGGRRFRSETVKVQLPGEAVSLEVEVRQPTYADQQRIIRAGNAQGGKESQVDGLAIGFEATLLCTYVDGVRLFDEADRKALLEMPGCSELVQAVSAVVMKLIAATPTEKDAEKN